MKSDNLLCIVIITEVIKKIINVRNHEKENCSFHSSIDIMLLFNSCYSFNDTKNLLYLQAYFNNRNVKKVNDYHQEMSHYSANLKINDQNKLSFS